jgi:hypothetical protein
MRVLGLLILAAAAAVPIEVVLGQEAHTTRIEPRPYYGAVVTVDAVRRRPIRRTGADHQSWRRDPLIGCDGGDRRSSRRLSAACPGR